MTVDYIRRFSELREIVNDGDRCETQIVGHRSQIAAVCDRPVAEPQERDGDVADVQLGTAPLRERVVRDQDAEARHHASAHFLSVCLSGSTCSSWRTTGSYKPSFTRFVPYSSYQSGAAGRHHGFSMSRRHSVLNALGPWAVNAASTSLASSRYARAAASLRESAGWSN